MSTLDSILATVDERFKSANAVPVDRATIKDGEWLYLHAWILGAKALLKECVDEEDPIWDGPLGTMVEDFLERGPDEDEVHRT